MAPHAPYRATGDHAPVKADGPLSFGVPQLVGLVLLAVAALIGARYLTGGAPVIAAVAVAALVPKQQGWNVRAPIAAMAGLLALFVVRMWPAVAGAVEATPPHETPHLLSWIIFLPMAGAV